MIILNTTLQPNAAFICFFFYCLNCYSFDLSETSPFAHGRLKRPGHVVVWQENEIPHSGSCAEFLVLIFSCYYEKFIRL